MALIDQSLMEKEIDDLGVEVIVRVVTNDSFSKWGDASTTTKDYTKKAMVESVGDNSNQLVTEGEFLPGQYAFMFKGCETELSIGNKIKYDGKWFEIIDVSTKDIGGGGEAAMKIAKTEKI